MYLEKCHKMLCVCIEHRFACHLLCLMQRDALECETSELDAQQQQLDAKLMKLSKKVP